MARRYRKTKRRKNSDSSWKSLKKRFHLQKRLRRFGLALLVFSSVILTLGAVYAWYFLSQPFASAAETFGTTFSWDGREPLNLLWVEVGGDSETAPLANLVVVSLNPTSDLLSVFALPLEYEGALPASLKADQSGPEPSHGVESAAKNASHLLGIPIDGYLMMESEGLQQISGQLSGADLKGCFSIRNITHLPRILILARKHLQTNLSLGELARVIYYLWRVRSDRVQVIDFTADVLTDSDAVDAIVAPLVRDETLVAERLKIQVLNGTTKPGLASFAARIVRNMGGEVIRIGNYERQDLTKGSLVLSESGSYTAKRLSRVFGVSDGHPPRSSVEKRANITIVLGMEEYERIF